MHADPGDPNDAVNVLDVTLDITGDAIRVIGNLANCQGP